MTLFQNNHMNIPVPLSPHCSNADKASEPNLSSDFDNKSQKLDFDEFSLYTNGTASFISIKPF
jgi:hypothetical protein